MLSQRGKSSMSRAVVASLLTLSLLIVPTVPAWGGHGGGGQGGHGFHGSTGFRGHPGFVRSPGFHRPPAFHGPRIPRPFPWTRCHRGRSFILVGPVVVLPAALLLSAAGHHPAGAGHRGRATAPVVLVLLS